MFYYYNKSKDTIFGKNIIKTIKWDRDVLSPNLILNILFQIVKSALDISNFIFKSQGDDKYKFRKNINKDHSILVDEYIIKTSVSIANTILHKI